MKTHLIALFTFAASAVAAAGDVEQYNIVWDSPSADARGSMPIGNGDIGLNVWIEPSGDLYCFIGKTDAWDENMRLLKLTKVRVKFEPALDVKKGFRWELKLCDGVIEIQDGKSQVRVWVDANHPVIQVDAPGRSAHATLEPWRTTKRDIGSPRSGGRNEYFSTGYTSLPAISYPDTMLANGWYHRNVDSPWLPSLKLQRNDEIAKTTQDPILHRTMGGIIRGNWPMRDTQLSKTEIDCNPKVLARRSLTANIHVRSFM